MAHPARDTYWSAVIADFRRSGLTHVRFCQLRRISIHSFRHWLYRLPLASQPHHPSRPRESAVAPPHPVDAPAFLPVHVRPRPLPALPHQPSPPPPIELVLDDRHQLRLHVGFDPDTLRQLLDVLERRS